MQQRQTVHSRGDIYWWLNEYGPTRGITFEIREINYRLWRQEDCPEHGPHCWRVVGYTENLAAARRFLFNDFRVWGIVTE